MAPFEVTDHSRSLFEKADKAMYANKECCQCWRLIVAVPNAEAQARERAFRHVGRCPQGYDTGRRDRVWRNERLLRRDADLASLRGMENFEWLELFVRRGRMPHKSKLNKLANTGALLDFVGYGSPMAGSTFARLWRSLAQAAGLPPVKWHPHVAKHTTGTLLEPAPARARS